MDQKIVGVIDGYIIDSIHYKEKVSFFEHLCVDKKYRKKRIAAELIQEFSNKSKKRAMYINYMPLKKIVMLSNYIINLDLWKVLFYITKKYNYDLITCVEQ